ncbi:hypothetical protein [Streptomyces brasiliensis]|uniref:Uncharacterized protein n=1 Tax=Streptomyces brasiliensis TaxID=1954 RepID=A0A917PCU7_9ACTN|nr:hypothetical protein [Streptomyces brasiliensis]GGJ70890.1 hypothetical protein GCM10010121_096880 [Streptomyces brasiliensis]
MPGTHLGHVVGTLLDGGPRYGTGTVRTEVAGRAAAVWDVDFLKPDRWRADDGTERWACDGSVIVTTGAAGSVREERPARAGWVPLPLQPFFPLAAPVWGRRGDDWRLCEGPAAEDGRLVVEVESIRPAGHRGRLVLDAELGYLTALLLPGVTVTVTAFAYEPPDPARWQT